MAGVGKYCININQRRSRTARVAQSVSSAQADVVVGVLGRRSVASLSVDTDGANVVLLTLPVNVKTGDLQTLV